jgi:uncharacterized membrane protein YeaQ/YmgE (transglycosylase-associated protein family)
MAWKNLPLWLKGGIIAVVLMGIIAGIAFFIEPKCTSTDCGFPLWNLILLYPAIPVTIPLTSIFEKGILPSLIVLSIYYFIVGAIIGWIVGKIKFSKR